MYFVPPLIMARLHGTDGNARASKYVWGHMGSGEWAVFGFCGLPPP